jgi:hypothetical protein
MHGGTDAGWVVMRWVNCVGSKEPHAKPLVLTQTAAKEKVRMWKSPMCEVERWF